MTSTITERRRQYAAFLELFAWRWWLTLTFERSHSLAEGNRRLERYFRTLEALYKDELSCLICPEWTSYSGCGKPGGRLHYHVLLGCARTYEGGVFSNLWIREEFGGQRIKGTAAEVQPYDRSRGAAFYALKCMSNASWDYEARKLELISPVEPISASRTSTSRRRLRRYQERCELARKEDIVETSRVPSAD